MPVDPRKRPDPNNESDLVFVDNADEARKPKPPQRGTPPPGSAGVLKPAADPQRAAQRSSGSHVLKPRAEPVPNTRELRRRQTQRLGRPPRRPRPGGRPPRDPGAQSGSVRIPAPTLEKRGPDPHLRIDGDHTHRPFWLVSVVLKEPLLLSRDEPVVIGRGEGLPVQVRSNLVSREHAEIRWDGDAFVVRDLGSTNGTFLNGYPLKEGVPLRHGDTIFVGSYELDVRITGPGEDPEDGLDGMTRPFRKLPGQ